MDHAFYVYSSYGFAALIIIVVIGLTWFDGRLRCRELASLEASGIHRRSQRKPEASAQ